MRGSEPDPMVPEMPTETESTTPELVADGGEQQRSQTPPEAPLVPDYR